MTVEVSLCWQGEAPFLGHYPDTSLSVARAARDEARKLLASGIDPSVHRKASKEVGEERAAGSFEVIAREWFAKQAMAWSANHAETLMLWLENDIFPWLGKWPVAERGYAQQKR